MSKMVRTPIVLATSDNIASATPLEPMYNEENGDIIIKNKNGHTSTSIYRSFKEKLVSDGYLSSKYMDNLKNKKVFGFTINLNEHDPYDSVQYINDCADFDPITFNSDGSCNYGAWRSVIKEYFGITPCLLKKDGTFNKELKDTNYTVAANTEEDLDVKTGAAGDVMVRFSKKYYKIEIFDDTITFKVANYKIDDSYTCDAFLDCDGKESDVMLVSAYNGSIVNSKLRSVSGKTPTKFLNIDNMRTNMANRDSDGYIGLNISRYIYLQCLIWLFTKNCNTKSMLKYNGEIRTTGYLNATDLFYNSDNGYKLLGIENFLLYNNFIEGIMVDGKTIKYKMNGNYDKLDQYKTVINNELLTTGYISELTTYDGKLVLPLSLNGSSHSNIGIKYNNNITDNDRVTPLVMNIDNIVLGGTNNKSAYSMLTYCKEV